MRLGKVPGHILERLFATIETKDPQVILGPRLGEDVALLHTGNWILAAKTDPITFAKRIDMGTINKKHKFTKLYKCYMEGLQLKTYLKLDKITNKLNKKILETKKQNLKRKIKS